MKKKTTESFKKDKKSVGLDTSSRVVTILKDSSYSSDFYGRKK